MLPNGVPFFLSLPVWLPPRLKPPLEILCIHQSEDARASTVDLAKVFSFLQKSGLWDHAKPRCAMLRSVCRPFRGVSTFSRVE
jgi:hypothetical protein